MEHELELIIARLEILEIEVCNISYKPRDIGNLSFSTSSYPGNIGNLSFSTSSYPGNIGKRIFSTSSYPGNIGSYDPYSVLSWKYWIVRSILSPILEIVDRTIQYLLIILKTFNIDLGHFIYKSIYFSYVDHDFLINQPNKTNSNPYNSQSSHAFKTNAGFKGISS